MDNPDAATVCVVGSGLARAMLSLLLARSGIDVVLLEKHGDFLRDFRGDTVHPTTLEVLDELGLVEDFLERPHRKVQTFKFIEWVSPEYGRYATVRFTLPVCGLCSAVGLSELHHHGGCAFPAVTLLMNAEVDGIIRDSGRVAGVRYRDSDGRSHEIRAQLTVAADGRGSTVRRAAGLRPRELGSSMDIVTFANQDWCVLVMPRMRCPRCMGLGSTSPSRMPWPRPTCSLATYDAGRKTGFPCPNGHWPPCGAAACSGIDRALRHPDKETPSTFARVPENRTLTRIMSHLMATGILPEHVRTPAEEPGDEPR